MAKCGTLELDWFKVKSGLGLPLDMSVQALSQSTSRSSSLESLVSEQTGGDAQLRLDVRLAINLIINKLSTTNEFTGKQRAEPLVFL